MILVLIPGIGVEVNGARRWINVVVTDFQQALLAMRGGSSEDTEEIIDDDAEPMSVICYQIDPGVVASP